jgi:cytochrome c oxidase assembly protein subunit 15
VIWVAAAGKYKGYRLFSKTKWLCLFLVILQVTLGVFTVLSSIHIRATKWNDFEWFAQLHQFVALLLLLALVFAAFLLNGSALFREPLTGKRFR